MAAIDDDGVASLRILYADSKTDHVIPGVIGQSYRREAADIGKCRANGGGVANCERLRPSERVRREGRGTEFIIRDSVPQPKIFASSKAKIKEYIHFQNALYSNHARRYPSLGCL